MVQSMTGFGKAEAIIKSKKIVVELRALNSKTLDLNLKYPEFLGDVDLLIVGKVEDWVNQKKGVPKKMPIINLNNGSK